MRDIDSLEHHLYIAISEYLRANPTKPADPLDLPVRDLPTPEGVPPPPAVPRGWKINSIVPLHSAAQSGGGVSENMLKDFQAAMQGQDPNAASSSAKAITEKKDKKKEKKKKK